MTENKLTMFAVGDVGPNRQDPDAIFQFVKPILAEADLAFCQLEPVLSNRGTPLPQARLPMRANPTGAKAIKNAGFHVVSFASNHCMDWGRDAFFDTVNSLREQNISVVGVGKDLEEARKPAIVNCNGTTIAFLAYNSILPYGYWAEKDRPGCAPMRAFTLNEQIELDQPGTPCRVHTFPHKDDLRALLNDIEMVRSQADIVILSMHWGIHFIPAVLADYQKEVARTAIDAGADLIIGHHSHILKGVEVYKGKVILYSLGNFALESPFSFAENMLQSPAHKEIQNLNKDWQPERSPLPPDSMKTVIAKCIIANKQIQAVSLLPTQIDAECQPFVLEPEDHRFNEIVKYLQEITNSQGLNTNYDVRGNELVVVP